MATVTIVSDSDEIYPLWFDRAANNIPYVLAVDASDNLVLYEGNAANPSSFNSYTVATSAYWDKSPEHGAIVIGEYSGTEYLWVIYRDEGSDLHLKRTPISSISFSDLGDITTDSRSHLSIDYDATNEVIGIHCSNGSKESYFYYSSNGGTSFTEVQTWYSTSIYSRGTGVAYQNGYWILANGQNRDLYIKRWSSGSGLQYYNGSSWASCSSSDSGYSTGVGNMEGAFHGKATPSAGDMVYFTRGHYNDDRSGAALSEDNAETWAVMPGHGYHGNFGSRDSCCLKTESGETNDLINIGGGDYSSGYEDALEQTYDCSVPSWGSANTLEDYSAGYVRYFAADLIQKNDWVGFAFGRYDGTSTYYVYYRHLETGTSASSDGESTIAASTRVAPRSEATIAASTRIALPNESSIAASTRVALVNESTIAASTRISITGISESTIAASTQVAPRSEVTIAASTRVALSGQSSIAASTRVALMGESVISASTQIALISASVKSASTRIALPNESSIAASSRVALVNESTIAASTRIQIIGSLQSENTINASVRIQANGVVTIAASVRIRRPFLYTQNEGMFTRNEKIYSQKPPMFKRLS